VTPMQVRNITRDAFLVTRGRRAGNLLTRGIGLLGCASLPEGDGLMIEPCNSIHMLFMRFPIDVLYVDRKHRVLRVCHGLRPWRMGPIVRRARYVLELPAGVAERTGTREGDMLEIRE
jgi:uncharacterized protein